MLGVWSMFVELSSPWIRGGNHRLLIYEVPVERNKFVSSVVRLPVKCSGTRGHNTVNIPECHDICIHHLVIGGKKLMSISKMKILNILRYFILFLLMGIPIYIYLFIYTLFNYI